MANENEKLEKVETPEQQEQSESELLQAYTNLKKNSVSIEEYNKLKAEKDQIIKSVIDERTITEKVEETPDLKALKEKWQAPNQNNLEYCINMLAFREALINSGETDPFLPFGKDHGIPTPEEQASAAKVARIIQECIDGCDGNSEVFTAMLNSRMVDPALPKKRK